MIKFFKNSLNSFKTYSFLMNQMIGRDFKVKYKRSVLGIVWSLLYPLLMMAVMGFVFSYIFKTSIEGMNYLVYLMTGIVMFNFFSEATNSAMTSVVTNFQLMSKVYIPKYIFPLSKCLFAGINFLLTLIPLLAVAVVTGAPITFAYFLLPYTFICIFLFSLGVGMLISTISVFFRDMFYIYGIIILIWQYLTPIFYVPQAMGFPEWALQILKVNPLYQYLDFAREILVYGRVPGGMTFLWCGLSAVVVLVIGLLVFKKNQDKFIYYA